MSNDENKKQLHIKLTPSASSNKIAFEETDMFGEIIKMRISVTAKPENGKANDAMIDLLSKRFSLSKSSFRIIKGLRVRNKVVRMVGFCG